jgi:hypothetical protein
MFRKAGEWRQGSLAGYTNNAGFNAKTRRRKGAEF